MDLKFKLYLMVLWFMDFIFKKIDFKKKMDWLGSEYLLGGKFSSRPYPIWLESELGDRCSDSEMGGAKSDSSIHCHPSNCTFNSDVIFLLVFVLF
jgi:hypothetical protein